MKKVTISLALVTLLVLSLFPRDIWGIQDILSELSYPSELNILYYSEEGNIGIAIKKEKTSSIIIVPSNRSVKIGKYNYTFKKVDGETIVFYTTKDGEFNMLKISTENPFKTTDGYQIVPISFIPNVEIVKLIDTIDTPKGVYKKEKQDAQKELYTFKISETKKKVKANPLSPPEYVATNKVPTISKQDSNLTKEDTKIILNFKDVTLRDAILSLSSQSGININFDKDVDTNAMVSAYYNGISIDEAINSITSGLDLSYRKNNNVFTITAYEEKFFDVNKILDATSFNQSESLTSTGVGRQAGQNTTNASSPMPTSTSAASPSPASTEDISSGESINAVINSIKKVMSPAGIISYIPSGFIYVKDKPSRLRQVENLLAIDNDKREEIKIKITLIRIDYRKEYETGVDWSLVFDNIRKNTKINIGTKFLGNLVGDSNVALVKFTSTDNPVTAAIKALSVYGDVNIVHTWETKAMSGVTLPFELTQDVWYNAGTTVQVVNNQTITSQNIGREQVGLRIILNPILQADNKYLVNTYVNLSNVVGFQKIGDQELPQTEKNTVQVPIKMQKGDTAVISGFKIKNTDKLSEGIPFLANIPILKHIFGHTKATDKTSEMSVLITIEDDN